MKSLKRSDFLKKLGMSLTAAPMLLGTSSCKTEDPNNDKEHCGLTDAATAGPFYVRNSAESVNINFTNLPGTPMRVQGTIFGGTDGETPIPNVKIEIWHADDKGAYHPEGSGKIADYDISEIALRGYVYSNEKGEYAFTSIEPGLYGPRRRHIHFKFTVDGHKELITQSYWLNEKGTPREASDGTDANTEDCRYVDFQDDGNGGIAGIFDVYLDQA